MRVYVSMCEWDNDSVCVCVCVCVCACVCVPANEQVGDYRFANGCYIVEIKILDY